MLAIISLKCELAIQPEFLTKKQVQQYLANDNSGNEQLTTAWLIDFMARWFHIMSSTDIRIVLSHEKPEKYNEAIQFLEKTIELFSCIKVGNNGRWKLFQTALIISTKTVI